MTRSSSPVLSASHDAVIARSESRYAAGGNPPSGPIRNPSRATSQRSGTALAMISPARCPSASGPAWRWSVSWRPTPGPPCLTSASAWAAVSVASLCTAPGSCASSNWAVQPSSSAARTSSAGRPGTAGNPVQGRNIAAPAMVRLCSSAGSRAPGSWHAIPTIAIPPAGCTCPSIVPPVASSDPVSRVSAPLAPSARGRRPRACPDPATAAVRLRLSARRRHRCRGGNRTGRARSRHLCRLPDLIGAANRRQPLRRDAPNALYARRQSH